MIILASASPRRRSLLKKLVKKFKVIPSSVDESKLRASSPEAFAVKAALAKAADVAEKQKNSIVIGADTIVVLGKQILGKPKNKKGAFQMLKKLVGRTHKVITGIAVINSATGKTFADLVVTKVKMKRVADEKIEAYVKTGKPLDKAGSYGIQEIEEIFIDGIKGDYENVVGLPLRATAALLKKIR